MFSKCKVTVVKRSYDKELVESYLNNPEDFSVCNLVTEDQEFIVSSPFEMPENMCAYAWADIRPYILTLASGGTFGFMKDKNTAFATCTDPLRPVIFKITRIQ